MPCRPAAASANIPLPHTAAHLVGRVAVTRSDIPRLKSVVVSISAVPMVDKT